MDSNICQHLFRYQGSSDQSAEDLADTWVSDTTAPQCLKVDVCYILCDPLSGAVPQSHEVPNILPISIITVPCVCVHATELCIKTMCFLFNFCW